MCMLTLFTRTSWLLKWFNAFWLYSFASVILFWCFWIFRFFSFFLFLSLFFFLSFSFLLPLIFHSHSICKWKKVRWHKELLRWGMCAWCMPRTIHLSRKSCLFSVFCLICAANTRARSLVPFDSNRQKKIWKLIFMLLKLHTMNRARTLTFCFHRVNYDISYMIACTAAHSRTI